MFLKTSKNRFWKSSGSLLPRGGRKRVTDHHIKKRFNQQNQPKLSVIYCTMKLALTTLAASFVSVTSFAPQLVGPTISTPREMFSGAGEGMPNADDPEEQKKMEQAAKAMGMSVAEYKLGISARVRLSNELDAARIKAGNTDTVEIERDANNPPKLMEFTVTDAGKELGAEGFSKELCEALKKASDDSRKIRAEAQKGMMQFIQEEMKGLS